MAGRISVLVMLFPFLAFGNPTTGSDDMSFHNDIHGMNGDPVNTRRPWHDRHEPPPMPKLPPMPPNAEEFSVCSMRACSCKSRTKDGEELVDITCNCAESNGVIKIWEGILPPLADTLEITDCSFVRLGGVDMAVGEDSSAEGGGRRVPGYRSSSTRKNRSLGRRRKREEAVGEEAEEEDGGGVVWEEAVWEAELGSPDEDEDETDPPEEEEPDTTTEGEESEKGGRYARAIPVLNGPRPLSSLIVRRVGELRIKPHAVGPVRSVLLEHITVIQEFPPYAFQPPYRPLIHPSGFSQAESDPHGEVWEMESVTLKNISDVKKFSVNSFSNILVKSHFLWDRTNVVIMDMNAIKVQFNALDEDDSVDPCETSYRAKAGKTVEETNVTTGRPSGEEQGGEENSTRAEEGLKTACEAPQGVFSVTNSVISMWSMNAFSVSGARSVSFSGCIATSLRPASIFVGSANFFSFTRNNVLESVSAYAFSVTASFVEFRRNKFGRLQEAALAGVKPMPSKILYGLPHFTFEDNLLIDVDLWSLHPSWDISKFRSNKSDGLNTEGFSFHKNSFADCSCPHLGWIVQMAVEQEVSSKFYAHLLEDESGNYCVREAVEPMGFILPCRLPLMGITSLFEEDGITCKRHVDVEELCEMYKSVASRLISSDCSQALIILIPWALSSILISTILRVMS